MTPSQRKAMDRSFEPRPNILVEYCGFLQATQKWWLVPILLVVMALGMLMFLGTTGAAPFIYTLF